MPLFDRRSSKHSRHEKRAAVVSLGLNRSRGLKFGVEGNNLQALIERTDEDWFQPTKLHSGEEELLFDGLWQRWIQFAMESEDPLPWEVEGFTVEVWFGEP